MYSASSSVVTLSICKVQRPLWNSTCICADEMIFFPSCKQMKYLIAGGKDNTYILYLKLKSAYTTHML